jgi:hypothetical protein
VNGDGNLVPATPIEFFKFGPGRPAIFGLRTGTYQPEQDNQMNGVERAATSNHEAIEDITFEDTGPEHEVPFFEFDPPRLPYVFNDPAYMRNQR